MNRRHFLKTAGGGAAGVAAGFAVGRRGWLLGRSPNGITKFRTTLPGLGPDGANNLGNFIPVLSPDTRTYPGIDVYDIVARQFTQTLHPAIGPTRLWGYGEKDLDHKYLGGVIVATGGRPVKLRVTNQLPSSHVVPVDPTAIDPPAVNEAGGRVDRITVHLHGAVVAWTSDGGPMSWFTNARNPGGFAHGSSFLNGGPAPGSAVYDYPNSQSARLAWYHDHAYGITRLNAYAGLASAYLITDDAESMMIKSGVLPDVPGYPLGIPLIIQDKSFFDPESDPTYPVTAARKGDLWYPHVYPGPPIPEMKLPLECGATGRWSISGGTPPSVSLVPEAFFDTNLVNGAPYPTLAVAPRRYRFQTLNAAQARFYNFQLYVADQSADGITLIESTDLDNNGNPIKMPRNPAGPKIIQIGKDSGLLPAPVVLNDPPKSIGYLATADDDPRNGNVNRYNLLLAPGERADLIVDFRGFEGQSIVLYNDAPAPFPMGDIRNDYYAGAPDLACIGRPASTTPGYGPDTRIVMRFDVARDGAVNEMDFEQTLASLQKTLPAVYLQTLPRTPETSSPAKVKTLDEGFDRHGRLMQMLGSPHTSGYLATPTDVASRGETQIWQVYNLTGDTHPIHWHLVNVQVVKREAWQADSEGKPIHPLRPAPGTARPPDPNEAGWKETLRMDPGEVTTVIMKFDMPFDAPPSPRLQSEYGLRGAEYLWHCHILEHEEHDMMRPLVIV